VKIPAGTHVQTGIKTADKRNDRMCAKVRIWAIGAVLNLHVVRNGRDVIELFALMDYVAFVFVLKDVPSAIDIHL
jgi:hypothetical protein